MRHEQLSVTDLILGRISKLVEGLGAKNTGATVLVEESGELIHKTVLTFTNTPIALTDDAGNGQYGGVKAYTFPEGLILLLGAIVKGTLTGYASLIDTFDGAVALGTVTATTGNTLTGTEADLLPSTALTQAVDEVAAVDAVSAGTAQTESGARHIDGTAAAKEAFLNFLVTDDVAHGSGEATFTGTVTLVWTKLGDK
jgi:hypothetical protein